MLKVEMGCSEDRDQKDIMGETRMRQIPGRHTHKKNMFFDDEERQ